MFWRAWFRSYLLVLIAILVMFLVVFLAKDESLGGVSIEPRLWQHLSQVLPMAIFVAVFWSTAHTLSVWTMDGRWKNTQLLGIPSYVVLRGWEYGLILSSGALFIYFWALPAPIQPSWSTDHLLEERQVSYAGVDFIKVGGFVYFYNEMGTGRAERIVIGPGLSKIEKFSWTGIEEQDSWSINELTKSETQSAPLNQRSAQELWANSTVDRRSALELWKRFVLPWMLFPAGWILVWMVLKGVSPALAVLLVVGSLFTGQRALELSSFGIGAAALIACGWLIFGRWCRYRVSAWPNL